MIRMEHSFVVNRPVEEVFEFVTNIENATQWQSWAVEANITSEGPLSAGTQYTYVARLLGRQFECTGEVTAFEPNKRYTWKVTSGPIPIEADTAFEPVEGGTRVTFTAQGGPSGFFGLAEPIVDRVARRQALADAENLKDLLEARAESHP